MTAVLPSVGPTPSKGHGLVATMCGQSEAATFPVGGCLLRNPLISGSLGQKHQWPKRCGGGVSPCQLSLQSFSSSDQKTVPIAHLKTVIAAKINSAGEMNQSTALTGPRLWVQSLALPGASAEPERWAGLSHTKKKILK